MPVFGEICNSVNFIKEDVSIWMLAVTDVTSCRRDQCRKDYELCSGNYCHGRRFRRSVDRFNDSSFLIPRFYFVYYVAYKLAISPMRGCNTKPQKITNPHLTLMALKRPDIVIVKLSLMFSFIWMLWRRFAISLMQRVNGFILSSYQRLILVVPKAMGV